MEKGFSGFWWSTPQNLDGKNEFGAFVKEEPSYTLFSSKTATVANIWRHAGEFPDSQNGVVIGIEKFC